jgi:hypothetical protein
MSIKPTWYIVLVASILVLALSGGPQPAATVLALPAAAVTLPYSGRLGDETGQPVGDGAYHFTFGLYDAPDGGNLLWSEIQTGVSVRQGAFAALLGSVEPLSEETLAGAPWLAVGVQGPGETEWTTLAPRQKLSPASRSATASLVTAGAACPHDHWGALWSGSGVGLHLVSSNDTAVWAESNGGWAGMDGRNTTGIGAYGASKSGTGVYGRATAASGDTYGVVGRSDSTGGTGVKGVGGRTGVYGETTAASNTVGVAGLANASGCTTGLSGCYGVQGSSNGGYGVQGTTGGSGVGVHAYASGNGVALRAEGQIGGNLIEAWHGPLFPDRKFYVTNGGEVYADGQFHPGGADMAEMLPAVAGLEPGDVLAMGPDGKLAQSSQPYQTSVVGVYSTRPGIVGGAEDGADLAGKVPLAVVGVAPVKATAENGPIYPGDLLVASSTAGHAMKAGPNPPTGTVIGKALGALEALPGSGVIQMLVTLQ